MEKTPKSTGHYISFDGTPIYYEVRGEGEPLVFVYGIACLINHWHYQIEYFSRNFKVICFDLRGHHKSNPVVNMENLDVESLSKDLLGLLSHLQIKRAHFVGHSFGVPLILQCYEISPRLFSSMILINGFAQNPIKDMFGLDVVEPLYSFIKSQYSSQPLLWNTLWKMLVENPLSAYAAGLLGGFNLKVVQFEDIEVYMRGVARMRLDVFIPLFDALMTFNGESILPKIKVPTLVLSGERDAVTPLRFQSVLKEKIQDSTFVLVPYGSHCTQLDFPDYVNLKIEKFLNGVDLTKKKRV